MDEINYAELFGLDEGENVQEAADPAGIERTDGEEGGEAQEAADPAVGEDAAGAEEETADSGKKTQSQEQNAAFAAARRKAESERDAAIAQAKAEAEETIRNTVREVFATAGLNNPYTGKPITSKEEYDAYKTQYDAEQRRAAMERAGMTQEEWDKLLSQQPEVVEARKAKAEAEEAVRRAAQAEAKTKLEEQVREISALDPGVQTLEDVTKQENYPRVYELVKQGLSLTDAYKLANYDRLIKGGAEAARQAAINATAGKAHMTRTGQRGAGAVVVPAEVAEQYRLLNPGVTDAEIQAHYARYHKQ